MKILHINFKLSNKWGYKIINACNKANLKGLLSTPAPWKDEALLHFCSRLDALSLCIQRLNTDVQRLFKEIDTHSPDIIEECVNEGRALVTTNNQLRVAFMVDIHSYLYELDACIEFLTEHILIPIYSEIFQWNKNRIKKYVTTKLQESNINPKYIREVKDLRNHYTHSKSAHIALALEEKDIIILKSNIHDFSDPNEFFYLGSDLAKFNSSFWNSMRVIENFIEHDIKNLDHGS
ncbi:hypothetical protein [Paenibacillus polysaccharolyticus]|uniref:hypothetical protein n=1 Tax=Paenibacillus polysaccharolyticus TaxID=582692 RepID=UPI00280C36F6|nr:hypothetical protein [Paenibacillus polysaccharolyticus]